MVRIFLLLFLLVGLNSKVHAGCDDLSRKDLVKIAGLEALKIPYRAVKKEFVSREGEERLKQDSYILNVQLGPLSPAEFEKVANHFKGLRPEYHARRKYKLEEFLTPFVQATVGKQFVPMLEEYKWPNMPDTDDSAEGQELMRFQANETPLYTLLNCWTTVYEFLRTWRGSLQSFDMMWISRASSTIELTEKITRKLKSSEKLQWGDILFFLAKSEGAGFKVIQHAAIFVTDGLYFEKTDSGQDDAFRFVLGVDVQESLKKKTDGKATSAHYRLKQDAELPLLSATRNLAREIETYGPLLPNVDLSTLAIEYDWGLSGVLSKQERLQPMPFRIYTVGIVKGSDGYTVDPNSPTAKNFQSPKWKDQAR